jgi:DNA polymerase III delta subunit
MQNHQPSLSALNRLIIGGEPPFDLHALLQSTSRTLSNLDFEHQHEMQRVERSRTDPVLKRQIIDNLKRRHRERRQPYLALIAELQSHLLSAASDDLQATG